MPKTHTIALIALIFTLAVSAPSAGEQSLTSLAATATSPSVDAKNFAGDVNAQRLRLLQHAPDDADITAIPALVDAFARANREIQDDVLVLLAHLLPHSGEHRAIILQTAHAGLASPTIPVRKEALEVFRRSEDPAFIPVIIAMFDDPSVDVRYQALHTIAPFAEAGGFPEIYEAVSRFLDDDNQRLRFAARSLMRFAHPPVVD